MAMLAFQFSPVRADIIHAGTQSWVQAARTGRADMLILGDSVVFHNGNGWDAGFDDALNRDLGLAGSGLVSGGSGIDGNGFAIGQFYGSPWVSSPAAVPINRQGYVWRGTASTIGSVPNSAYFAETDGTTLRAPAGYNWNLYTASPVGSGAFGAYSRISSPPYTTLQTLPTVITNTPADGLQKTVLHFDSPPAAGQFFLQNVTKTSIL